MGCFKLSFPGFVHKRASGLLPGFHLEGGLSLSGITGIFSATTGLYYLLSFCVTVALKGSVLTGFIFT